MPAVITTVSWLAFTPKPSPCSVAHSLIQTPAGVAAVNWNQENARFDNENDDLVHAGFDNDNDNNAYARYDNDDDDHGDDKDEHGTALTASCYFFDEQNKQHYMYMY
jgi:hypothetical protein